MNKKVTVINYGIGNLFSICNALRFCGAEVSLTDNPTELSQAERLVLPGVGAFEDGMAGLKERNFIEAIIEAVSKERPFLGICLGMQMMLDESQEFGTHQGLGIIPGKVVPIPPVGPDGTHHKIPHIGWNSIVPLDDDHWVSPILQNIPVGTDAYFVHSFTATTAIPNHTQAICQYNGLRLSAVIGRDYAFGCQFHPEKSGKKGLTILKNFLSL